MKGHWSSLRGLQLHIDSARGLQFATLWIIACVHLHGFAMEHKDGIDMSQDVFFKKGLKIMENKAKEHQVRESGGDEEEEYESGEVSQKRGEVDEEIELLYGRIKREELKVELKQRIEGYIE